jgi:hypothetical protein
MYGTHIFNDTHKADSAALSDVILSAAKDEGGWDDNVQIEIMGYCASSCRHLQQIIMSIH